MYPTPTPNKIIIRRPAAPILISLSVAVVLAAVAGFCLRLSPVKPDAPETLARLRAHTPPGMALVPAGEFLAGSNDADADDEVRPLRHESLPAFYIDLHEVTNREFQKFD